MRLSLVPQEKRFYELFRQQGELVSESLTELSRALLEGRSRHDRLRDLEHACDDVTRQLYELTHKTFVVPMEREDILELAAGLDDIVDLAEEVSDKMELYHVTYVREPARLAGECLPDAGRELERALERLEDFEVLGQAAAGVYPLEEQVDRITREGMAQLFADEGLSAAELIKWKDLYDLIEATMDACEDVANTLQAISIKNA
ncbi:MAG: DUF47 family protein [Candidatus Dormibacteraeota bacterium]|nr:DUF47 family protein [Candidatus Dormibacteraeota bacterium]